MNSFWSNNWIQFINNYFIDWAEKKVILNAFIHTIPIVIFHIHINILLVSSPHSPSSVGYTFEKQIILTDMIWLMLRLFFSAFTRIYYLNSCKYNGYFSWNHVVSQYLLSLSFLKHEQSIHVYLLFFLFFSIWQTHHFSSLIFSLILVVQHFTIPLCTYLCSLIKYISIGGCVRSIWWWAHTAFISS